MLVTTHRLQGGHQRYIFVLDQHVAAPDPTSGRTGARPDADEMSLASEGSAHFLAAFLRSRAYGTHPVAACGEPGGRLEQIAMYKCALYPGTFDPMTLGHLDLVRRSAEIFDEVILAVASSSRKSGCMFNVEERVAMATAVVAPMKNVSVEQLDGLLIDHARVRKVRVVIRGLRAYSDFEYEFQMALTNRKLAPEVETLFMMPKEEHSYVSSSMVREIARFGGDIGQFVPDAVAQRIRRWRSRNDEEASLED